MFKTPTKVANIYVISKYFAIKMQILLYFMAQPAFLYNIQLVNVSIQMTSHRGIHVTVTLVVSGPQG